MLGPQPSPRMARRRAGQLTPFSCRPHQNMQAYEQQTHSARASGRENRKPPKIAGSPRLPSTTPQGRSATNCPVPAAPAWRARAHSNTQISQRPGGRTAVRRSQGTTSPGPGWAGSSWKGLRLVDTTKGGVEGQELTEFRV